MKNKFIFKLFSIGALWCSIFGLGISLAINSINHNVVTKTDAYTEYSTFLFDFEEHYSEITEGWAEEDYRTRNFSLRGVEETLGYFIECEFKVDVASIEPQSRPDTVIFAHDSSMGEYGSITMEIIEEPGIMPRNLSSIQYYFERLPSDYGNIKQIEIQATEDPYSQSWITLKTDIDVHISPEEPISYNFINLPTYRYIRFNLMGDDLQQYTKLCMKKIVLQTGVHSHTDLMFHPAVAPDCTHEGNIAYYECDCGKLFLDADGIQEVTYDDVILPMTDHQLDIYDAVEPTCLTPGNLEYAKCEVCNKYFTIVGSSWVETEWNDIYLPALGHDWASPTYEWEYDEEMVPISCHARTFCTRDGCGEVLEETTTNIEYRVIEQPSCSTEGIALYVAVFENEIFTASQEVYIPRTSHDIHTNYVWDDEGSDSGIPMCTGTAFCTMCELYETETCYEPDFNLTTYPTKDDPSRITWIAHFESVYFSTQMRETTLPSLSERDAWDIQYLWETDEGRVTCKAIVTSLRIEVISFQIEAVVTSVTIREATCEQRGLVKYTAEFIENDGLDTQVQEIETDYGDHTYGEPTYEWVKGTDGVTMFCTGYVVCDICGSIEESSGYVTSEVTLQPTVTEPGIRTYTAIFNSIHFTTQYFYEEIPPVDPSIYDVQYTWRMGDDGYFCYAFALNIATGTIDYEEEVKAELVPEVEPTCTEPGYGQYVATFKLDILFTPQTSEDIVEIPAHGHEYYDYWIYDRMPTETETGIRSHHCKYCDHKIDIEETPTLDVDTAAESALGIIEPKTEEEQVVIESSLEELKANKEETLMEISTLVNNTVNDLQDQLASGEIDEEEYKEKVDIASAVTQSSVVISAQEDGDIEMGNQITESIPPTSGLDMGEIFGDFYERQMDIILGRNPSKSTKKSTNLSCFANEEPNEGNQQIDFNIDAETYRNAIEFVDTSIEHMAEAGLQIRTCSGEKLTSTMTVYITTIQYSTFQDFDKEAADAEFVENAYSAIMFQMQSEVLAQLQQELNNVSSQLEKDPAREDLIKQQIAAVNNFDPTTREPGKVLPDDVADMDEFEIIVLEVLRQNYNYIMETDISLEEFAPIYKDIFTRWALNEEQDVDITLEELTTAVVDKKVKQDTHFKIDFTAPGNSEIILFSCLGGAIILGAVGAVVGTSIYKKKHKEDK